MILSLQHNPVPIAQSIPNLKTNSINELFIFFFYSTSWLRPLESSFQLLFYARNVSRTHRMSHLSIRLSTTTQRDLSFSLRQTHKPSALLDTAQMFIGRIIHIKTAMQTGSHVEQQVYGEHKSRRAGVSHRTRQQTLLHSAAAGNWPYLLLAD